MPDLGEEGGDVMHVEVVTPLVADAHELVREIVESELTEQAMQAVSLSAVRRN